MQTKATEPVAYGPYSLIVDLSDGGNTIIRRDDGERRRTVAFADSLAEWDRFVTPPRVEATRLPPCTRSTRAEG